jgi:hypothetical protein
MAFLLVLLVAARVGAGCKLAAMVRLSNPLRKSERWERWAATIHSLVVDGDQALHDAKQAGFPLARE